MKHKHSYQEEEKVIPTPKTPVFSSMAASNLNTAIRERVPS